MFYSLLTVLVLFCATVGVGLWNNNNNVMAVLTMSFIAMLVIQIAYACALVVEALRHG